MQQADRVEHTVEESGRGSWAGLLLDPVNDVDGRGSFERRHGCVIPPRFRHASVVG